VRPRCSSCCCAPGRGAVVTRERALEEVWDGEATENVVDR
jgi:hypothetical protein